MSMLVLLAAAPASQLASVPPAPDSAFFQQIFDAFKGSNWSLLGVLLAVLAIFLVRRYGAGKLPFLATDRGGAVLALVAGALGALGDLLLSGHALDGRLVATALDLAISSAGGYVIFRKLLFPSDVSHASPAPPER